MVINQSLVVIEVEVVGLVAKEAEVVLAVVEIKATSRLKCTQLFVQTVARAVKYLLNHLETSQFIVVIVSVKKVTMKVEIPEGETDEITSEVMLVHNERNGDHSLISHEGLITRLSNNWQ